MTPVPVPIVLIEDNEFFANPLEKFFSIPESNIDCWAVYKSAEEALIKIPKNPPAIALVDINLPGNNGIDCIAQLKELCPSLVCIVLSIHEDNDLIFDALRAGAYGYLLKRTSPTEIADAVQIAYNGGSPMSPNIARQVVTSLHRSETPKPEQALTPREQEVLDLLIEGFSYQKIASHLGISIDTVRSHVRKVYGKLQIHSRTEIMLKFGRRG